MSTGWHSGPLGSFVWLLISDMTTQPDVLGDSSKCLMNFIQSEMPNIEGNIII